MAVLASQPPPDRYAGTEIMAPVLFLPRVFEPEVCRHLIGLYEENGGEESGFMREIGRPDRRRHRPGLQAAQGLQHRGPGADRRRCRPRFLRRVVPEIAKVHPVPGHTDGALHRQLLCGRDGGHFQAHP